MGARAQPDHGPPAVGRVLAPLDEAVIFEITRELARGGQRQAELAREVADRALALRSDLREHGDVPPAERRVAAHELEQLRRRPAPRPQTAHDPPQLSAQLCELLWIGYHQLTIIESEGRK